MILRRIWTLKISICKLDGSYPVSSNKIGAETFQRSRVVERPACLFSINIGMFNRKKFFIKPSSLKSGETISKSLLTQSHGAHYIPRGCS
jgi:hypothetical protein